MIRLPPFSLVSYFMITPLGERSFISAAQMNILSSPNSIYATLPGSTTDCLRVSASMQGIQVVGVSIPGFNIS